MSAAKSQVQLTRKWTVESIPDFNCAAGLSVRTFDLETTGLGFASVLAVEVATFSSHRRRDSSGTGRLGGRCNGKLGAFKIT